MRNKKNNSFFNVPRGDHSILSDSLARFIAMSSGVAKISPFDVKILDGLEKFVKETIILLMIFLNFLFLRTYSENYCQLFIGTVYTIRDEYKRKT